VREALCFDHQALQRALRICGFPPPSSGAITIGQILGLMSQLPAQANALQNGLPSAQWLHDYSEASRLAFADRALYIADPDFVQAPGNDWLNLLNPDYLRARALLVGDSAMKSPPAAGVPPNALKMNHVSNYAPMPDQIEHGTSHISIVDAQGNAIAMTTTIEDGFGSRQMVKGFLLNNELTDFSFAPRDAQGKPIANRVEPGKRPRSSMSPTLVFDKNTGQLLMSVGSPGGSLIIHFTAKTLWGVWHWGLSPQQAIDLPNFANIAGPLLLEKDRFDALTIEQLQQLGHEVKVQDLTSGLQSIVRTQQAQRPAWISGADPRREGVVLGR
jgi:gamma-glutamyltranspeptidase/glutathione hydrolase